MSQYDGDKPVRNSESREIIVLINLFINLQKTVIKTMKKILTFMLMMISMVLMSTLTSCHNHRTPKNEVDEDSLFVAEVINAVNHAEFTDVNEFMLYVVDKRTQHKADSIVFRMPDATLAGICNKIVNNHGKLSTVAVYDEYMANKPFYDGMSRFILHTNVVQRLDSYERDTTERSEE